MIVAFRVDNAGLMVTLDQTLQEADGKGGLAASGRAGHQGICTVRPEPDLLSICPRAQHDLMPLQYDILGNSVQQPQKSEGLS